MVAVNNAFGAKDVLPRRLLLSDRRVAFSVERERQDSERQRETQMSIDRSR